MHILFIFRSMQEKHLWAKLLPARSLSKSLQTNQCLHLAQSAAHFMKCVFRLLLEAIITSPYYVLSIFIYCFDLMLLDYKSQEMSKFSNNSVINVVPSYHLQNIFSAKSKCHKSLKEKCSVVYSITN